MPVPFFNTGYLADRLFRSFSRWPTIVAKPAAARESRRGHGHFFGEQRAELPFDAIHWP
jgi:hypothetical protein